MPSYDGDEAFHVPKVILYHQLRDVFAFSDNGVRVHWAVLRHDLVILQIFRPK